MPWEVFEHKIVLRIVFPNVFQFSFKREYKLSGNFRGDNSLFFSIFFCQLHCPNESIVFDIFKYIFNFNTMYVVAKESKTFNFIVKLLLDCMQTI